MYIMVYLYNKQKIVRSVFCAGMQNYYWPTPSKNRTYVHKNHCGNRIFEKHKSDQKKQKA